MINGNVYKDMIVSAANNLNNQKEKINSLNVFPVPDGDTGTNMGMTMTSAKKEVPNIVGDLGEVAAKTSMALVRGGRGNSGVILSLFFRGFSKGFANLREAGCKEVVSAFRMGVDSAYKAVKIPTEGTILTVMRLTADRMEEVLADGETDLKNLFAEAVAAANVALQTTPDLLPVLKQANVVDAGGKGFLTILEGMASVICDGVVVEASEKDSAATAEAADFGSFDSDDITFSYCTECIVDKNQNCTPSATDAVQSFINGIGSSVVFVDDDDFFKFHVHTNDPGKVITECLKYGSLSMVKIENMRNQHSAMSITNEENAVVAPTKKYGFVAISAGEGIDAVFKDLGVDKIVSGGQTMNPSTDDILKAINQTPAENVFVLPNNKNIYMAAKQTKELVTDRKVIVLKTVSVPQGISALLAFDETAEPDMNKIAMKEAMAAVTTASMTFAARNSTFDGNEIREGQLLGMVEGKVRYVTDTKADCMKSIASDLKGKTMVSLFYGEDESEEEAEKMADILREVLPDSEVDVIPGLQPVYYYIISAE